MQKIYLSKSKIKSNEQCPLMFWHELNGEKKVWDASTLFTFDQGRQVEQVGRNMFADGVLQNEKENELKVIKTKELLKLNKPIFEAAFAHLGCIVQFDILKPNLDGTYSASEIKSASSMKPDFKTDVIIQYWIATLSGITITNYDLWYVNKEATSITDNYFLKEDVTEMVKGSEDRFWELFNNAAATAKMKSAPDIKIGPHCKKNDCPFRGTGKCKLEKTPDHVLSLPRFPEAFEAYNKGILSINDPVFDKTYQYSTLHPLISEAIKTNKLVINREGLLTDFSKWKFPLNLFDFEALMSALPILEGQRPYAQVVFQFSNHVYDGVSDKLTHTMFLHDSLTSPNEPLIEAMLKCLEANEGSIVSFNETYEKTQIKELGKKYPQYNDRFLKLIERFVDLLDLVKDNTYHPEFAGSYSLKKVSPALLGEFGSYSDSLIKSGSEIAKYYMEMLTTTDMDRKQLIKNAMIKYSTYDTLNLFLVIKFLLDPSVDLQHLVNLNIAE
jgi:hypothetical protein